MQELEDCGETESSQYARLSVELCANYQQALQESFNEVYYAEIKRRIHQAFLHDHTLREHKLRRDFSSNFMLDILLNAYGVYHRSTEKQDTSEANDELAWILCAIDDMLDLEALVKEPNRDDIIIKIKVSMRSLAQIARKWFSCRKPSSAKTVIFFCIYRPECSGRATAGNRFGPPKAPIPSVCSEQIGICTFCGIFPFKRSSSG